MASPERPEKTVKDFALDEVKLLENSPFYENYKRAHDFLLSVNDDQQLYNFRTAAGLDTKGAPPMTGWDEPNGNLRGHTTGHYLSAIAYAYAGTKDERFKKKVDYMIAELAKCQDAMEASGKFNYGFLSGYSEEQFDKLEDFVPYPQIWAPYYTLHKIMAGLLDCYELAGNEQALEVVSKLGDWVYNRLSKLSKEHLNKMWAMYIAGEFGGINETMAKLYAVTGKETHLAAAQLFDNDKLFYPMSVNVDTLGGMHANQHAPQVIGALKIYECNNDPYYYDIAENFWDMVVNSHIYNIGGTGAGEMFKPANVIAKFITEKTAETCVTYNMLKLTRQLFFRNPEARYMDYYERALCNHILASQDQSGPVGGSTYFMPLFPGMRKGYDTSGNSCCHGTGMENHIKYQESIYFQSVDGSTLYVNLYIPSELNWNAKGVKVTQSGDFLREQKSVFTIDGEGEFEIKFRVPCWIEKDSL